MTGKVAREERRARRALDALLGFGRRPPEGGLGRALALWGFPNVPFFRAFHEPAGDDATAPLPTPENETITVLHPKPPSRPEQRLQNSGLPKPVDGTTLAFHYAPKKDEKMDDTLTQHFRTMARYNTIANQRLYETCARLPDAERKKPREAFFGSIHGTLNHLLVGDRIWLARFAGEDVPSTDLDAILYEGFGDLREARRREDARIEAFVAGLDGRFMGDAIRYVNNEGRTLEDPVRLLLAHFFNHQTHHRGQVHGMLSQTEVDPPVLNLHRAIRP